MIVPLSHASTKGQTLKYNLLNFAFFGLQRNFGEVHVKQIRNNKTKMQSYIKLSCL